MTKITKALALGVFLSIGVSLTSCSKGGEVPNAGQVSQLSTQSGYAFKSYDPLTRTLVLVNGSSGQETTQSLSEEEAAQLEAEMGSGFSTKANYSGEICDFKEICIRSWCFSYRHCRSGNVGW